MPSVISVFDFVQEKNWWHHNSTEYKQKLKEKIEHDKKRLQAWEKRDERMKDLHEVNLFCLEAVFVPCCL